MRAPRSMQQFVCWPDIKHVKRPETPEGVKTGIKNQTEAHWIFMMRLAKSQGHSSGCKEFSGGFGGGREIYVAK